MFYIISYNSHFVNIKTARKFPCGLALRKQASVGKLIDVSFVEEYKGKQIPAGKKSVTIRLVIASNEKTLTSDEIETVAKSVIKKLTKGVGADIRTA